MEITGNQKGRKESTNIVFMYFHVSLLLTCVFHCILLSPYSCLPLYSPDSLLLSPYSSTI